jgi:hypothetical protein
MSTSNKNRPDKNKSSYVPQLTDPTKEGLVKICSEEFPRYSPFVRYGFPKNRGQSQTPQLHPLQKDPPEDAITRSPVYLLTKNQIDRNHTGNPYAVKNWNSKAQKLQTECEKEGRVIYPIFVETDDAGDYGLYQAREFLKGLVDDVFNLNPEDGTWWFSGRRSIHAHLPLYVTNKTEIDRIKKEIKAYNKESEIKADSSIYRQKQLFRLPWAKHESTGSPKVPIPTNGDEEDIRRTTAAHLGKEDNQYTAGKLDFGRFRSFTEYRRDGGLKKHNEAPITERLQKPSKEKQQKLWKRYNRHHFSPYANTDNGRSIAVFRIKGTPFCRRQDESQRIYVPAYIYAALGGDRQYTITNENAPIYLSSTDYNKWDFCPGDVVGLIGGRSRSSRLFRLSADERWVLEGAIHDDIVQDKDRLLAVDCLSDFGYDVGSAGKNGPYTESSVEDQSASSQTEAAKFQQLAERGRIKELNHNEILKLGDRLLKINGWDFAWEHFKDYYGDEFDEDVTWMQLKSTVDKYYSEDIKVPPRP